MQYTSFRRFARMLISTNIPAALLVAIVIGHASSASAQTASLFVELDVLGQVYDAAADRNVFVDEDVDVELMPRTVEMGPIIESRGVAGTLATSGPAPLRLSHDSRVSSSADFGRIVIQSHAQASLDEAIPPGFFSGEASGAAGWSDGFLTIPNDPELFGMRATVDMTLFVNLSLDGSLSGPAGFSGAQARYGIEVNTMGGFDGTFGTVSMRPSGRTTSGVVSVPGTLVFERQIYLGPTNDPQPIEVSANVETSVGSGGGAGAEFEAEANLDIIWGGISNIRLENGITLSLGDITTTSLSGFNYYVAADLLRQFHWTNSGGGSFFVAENWSGNAIPEQGDEAIFDLSGAYGVDLSQSAVVEGIAVEQGDVTFDLGGNTLAVQGGVAAGIAVEPGASLLIGGGNLSAQAIRARGARLTFAPGTEVSVLNDVRSEYRSDMPAEIVMQGGMNVEGDIIVSGDLGSVFEVSGGGFLGAGDLMMDGGLSFFVVADGAAVFDNAHLHGGTLSVRDLSSNGLPSVLSVIGETTVHPASQAIVQSQAEAMFHDLFVNGGSILSGEELAAGLVVRTGGKVTADQIVVGASQPGSITVFGDSRIDVKDLVLSRGQMNVQGAGAMLDVLQSLTIATPGVGDNAGLLAEAGAIVEVTGDVNVGMPAGGTSSLLVDGEGTRFTINASGELSGILYAHPGSLVWFTNGARASLNEVSVSGDFELFGEGVFGLAEEVIVGDTASGSLAVYSKADFVSSDATIGLSHPSTAVVELDGSWSVAGTLRVGPTQGVLNIESGGQVDADHVLIATPSGSGVGVVGITGSTGPDGDPSLLSARGTLILGSGGTLSIDTDAAVTVGQTSPLPGFIRVGPGGDLFGFGILVGNVVNQGGTVHSGNSPGVLTIEGDYLQEEDGVLEVEIGGLTPGMNHDQLIVTGDANLDGVIQLKFFDGFAPQQGQHFEFLSVAGMADLGAASYELQNLAPGFEFEVVPSANGISMTALNDGVFLQPVVWNVDADGDWSVAENWTEGDPNVAGVSASFLGAATAPRTVNIDAPKTVAGLTFDSAHGYRLAGAGPLQFENGGFTTIQVTSGEHVLSAPVSIVEATTLTKRGAGTLTISGPQVHRAGAVLVANGGTTNLNSDGGVNLFVQTNSNLNFGTSQHLAGVTIGEGGKATLTSGGTKNLVTGALSIAGGDAPTGTLDLTENAAVIDYVGTSPTAIVRQQILAGRGAAGFGATWTGVGITSSSAAAQVAAEPESVSVAYAVNGELPLGVYTTFHGETVDETSVLITYTRTGDANLDGVVNDDDVTIVSATYAPGVSQPHWALGDFDYNGFVDDDDVTLLGVFYDPSALALELAAAKRQGGVASVPEPASIMFSVIVAATIAIATLRSTWRREHV